jgi:uncharacterized protein YegL
MRNDYVDITLVIDKSGSMQPLTNDTIGGVNRLLEDQRKVEGKAHVSIWQFNQVANLYRAGDIQSIENLTTATYAPAGNTALLDAVATAINSTGNRLRNYPESERPAKVIFVIVTDGQENASREFTRARVKQMIEEQTNKYSWEFVYLGANVNSFTEASAIGIAFANASNYGANSMGVGSTYTVISDKLETLRCRASKGLSANMAFTAQEQELLNNTVDSGSKTS